jgi:type VI secretion system secreted protein VgrG
LLPINDIFVYILGRARSVIVSKLTQDSRIGSFKSALGEDKLVIGSFNGTEGLSELFEYRMVVFGEDQNVDFDKILGTNCNLSIKSNHEGTKRNFNGVLIEAEWNGKDDSLSSFHLELRPWLWLLKRTTNCRILSEKTVPEILQEVFSAHSFAKFELRLKGDYTTLEYCVQYRESDFDFVSRLMEEFGIYYFFEHSENDHSMILADSPSVHKPKPAGAELAFYATDLKSVWKEDALNEWSVGRSFRSGKVKLNDYDYKKPTADMLAEDEAHAKYANAGLEIYDYPGRYVEKSDGKFLAKVKLEAEQARDWRTSAEGDAVTCTPGTLIKLTRHPESSTNKEYLTLRASHVFRSNAYRSSSESLEESYSGKYEFLPSETPYRCASATPKPVINGPQTAVVASEVDEQCRIKVFFHWDRDKKESRYVRIAHGWSGSRWGDIKIPRVGMEVIVEFLEGDPDKPLITGTVYNADNETPYPLPEDKSISGVKSQTIDGSGYNELILDDRDGGELIRLHAQRDLEGVIENDERREIKNDVKVDIGQNRKETIGATWTVSATQKIEFTVGTSTFTMTPAGITLKSTLIMADANATLSLQSKGIADLTAVGPVTIKGALVLIN